MAAKRTWTSYPLAQERLFRFPEEQWEALFRTPALSEETRNKVRAELGLASGTFKDPLRKRMEDDWTQADRVGRAGMKFASVFILCAEALLRSHQQLPGDPNPFTRKEVGNLLFLLGPLSRLIFDQFARVTLKATQVRRSNILDAFAWPSAEARDHLESLPAKGSDLFAGQFVAKLAEEVRKFQETAQLVPSNQSPSRSPHPNARLGSHPEGVEHPRRPVGGLQPGVGGPPLVGRPQGDGEVQ